MSGTKTFSGNLRVSNVTDVTLASTAHGFQIGPGSGENLAMDANEIQARNNGAASNLNLNVEGGGVSFGSSSLTTSGTITATGGNSTEWNTGYDKSPTAVSLANSGPNVVDITITQQDTTTLTGTVTITGATLTAGNGLSGSSYSGSTARTWSVDAHTGITVDTNGVSITSGGVGATQLNVTGDGTTSQYLRSDADGSFTWATPPDTDTTYSAGSGISLSGTTFSVSGGLGLSQGASGLSFDITEFTLDPPVSAAQFLVYDSDQNTSRMSASNINLSQFNNDTTFEENQDAFSNIAVSGETTVTAVTKTDTLTLVAGSNVTLTTSAQGKSVTIASTDTNTDTTYSAGNGISLSGTTFSVAGGSGLTQDASGLSITTGGVGADQLNVTGDGTTSQFLRSDADGSFT